MFTKDQHNELRKFNGLDVRRELLCLSDIAGLTQAEIAEVLEVNVGNVKIRLHRARRKMKEILKQHCNFGNDERAVLVCTPKLL